MLRTFQMPLVHLLYNKAIVDLCFGRHRVLLNSELNHIDLCYEVYCPITLHVHLNIVNNCIILSSVINKGLQARIL